MRSTSPCPCHLCGADSLSEFPSYQRLARVTSDCIPWRAGGTLAICERCGCIQKSITEKWRSETNKIYSNYRIYHQSGGAEQAIFNAAGQSGSRSAILALRLAESLKLPENGSLLDVGCGNGAFMREFGRVRPQWVLSGTELSDINRATVEFIPNVESFYTCSLNEIPHSFDLITMIHVLEHIPHPTQTLATIRGMLSKNGRLVIEVPDCLKNPFDLIVADHSTHFTASSLRMLVESSGFKVEQMDEGWIPKELTLVARRASAVAERLPADGVGKACVEAHLRWLEGVVATGESLEDVQNFGIFGTSIAGVWIFNALNGSPQFFVDEDPLRVGRSLLDRPVYNPGQTPAGGHVLIALPQPIGSSVAARLGEHRQDVSWRTP
jgi:SAM-dependent methyltransferase